MFSELLILFVVPLTFCKSQQVIYTRPRPLSSLYPPVTGRRVVTDDRLRLPIARYFPEVDTEVESAPVRQSYFPVADTYRLSADGLYTIPAHLVDQQRLVPARSEDDYFDAYDYDNEYAPVYPAYPDELYVQPQAEMSDADAYEDVMANYLLRELQPNLRVVPEESIEIQRRDRGSRQGVIPITAVMVANGKQRELPRSIKSPSPASSTASPSHGNNSADNQGTTTDSPVSQTSAPSYSLPSLSSSSFSSLSALKGSAKRTESEAQEQSGVWRSFSDADRGQKEFPLFRPAKSSGHQSMWSSLEEQLSRAKNSNYKRPIPLMTKLMESHRAEEDPLQDQLDNLKIHKL